MIPIPLFILAKVVFGTVASGLATSVAVAGVSAGHAYNRGKLEEELDLGINLRLQADRTLEEIERRGGHVSEDVRRTIRITAVPKFSTINVPEGVFGSELAWMEGAWVLTPEERIVFCHFIPRFQAEFGGPVDDVISRLVHRFRNFPAGRADLAKLVNEVMPSKLSTDEMRIQLMHVKKSLTPRRLRSKTYGKDLREALS